MTHAVSPCPLPPASLLARHCEAYSGAYKDNFVMEVPGVVDLPTFVEAFYSSLIFRPELISVRLLFGKRWAGLAGPLGRGQVADFSAWRVEARTETELLLREMISDRTRSWLKVDPAGEVTRLYFGTAVLPVGEHADGSPKMSALFSLIGFHKVYARVLLGAARAGLRR